MSDPSDAVVQKSDHEGCRGSGAWEFMTAAVLSLLVFLFVYQGALTAGFQVIDDGTINWELIQAAKADGLLEEVKAAWYRPRMQSGSRYAPMFYLYKLATIHAFGLNPWFHHLSHLLLCWIGAILPLVVIGRALKREWIPCLGIVLHAFVGDQGWSVHAWNMYDVSTYDPLATAAFSMACLMAWWMLTAKEKVAFSIAAAATLLCFFVASHSKETTALICLSLLPLIPVLAWCDQKRRRRWLLLWVLVLIPVVLFFHGFRASGALAASRADDYTKSYVVSGAVMAGNTKGTIVYLLSLMAPMLVALLLFLIANLVRLGLVWRHCRSLDVYHGVSLFLIYLLFMGFLQAMPNTLLKASSRFLYPAFVPMVMLLCLMLAFPCRAWLSGLCPSSIPLRPAKWVVRGATVALACLLVLAPLRLVSFNSLYRSGPAQEYQLARWCEARFREAPSSRIAVVAWRDDSTFYWSIFNHLRNEGIEPPLDQFIFVRQSEWSAPLTTNAQAIPCIVLSRVESFSQSLSKEPRVVDSQPVPGNESLVYPHTKSGDLWKWVRGQGPPPWTSREDHSGFRVGTYAYEPPN